MKYRVTRLDGSSYFIEATDLYSAQTHPRLEMMDIVLPVRSRSWFQQMLVSHTWFMILCIFLIHNIQFFSACAIFGLKAMQNLMTTIILTGLLFGWSALLLSLSNRWERELNEKL